ncbi:hypothetical protein [Nitratireductor arenosus]|uniref:hypothetical protein n=1 Tax=Nitratireductor arenosus TaxID=2682096 RepID=UPI0012EA2E5A|nr:hypothetical protein [Nitratireductor arenosus]
MVSVKLASGLAFLREFAQRLRVRRDTAPIDSVETLCRFASTRAAFATQKKLYGYLKARMGTRYPSMFEDEAFVASVNIAKMHVFAASLSDLTVYAVGRVGAGTGLDETSRRALARTCFRVGLADNVSQVPDEASMAGWLAAFERRLDEVHWANLEAGGDAFIESPAALLHWAPVADRLKRYDAEIVENSIRFAWIEIRRDLARRLDARAVAADGALERG